MTIDWLAFLAVFGVALVSSCLIVLCFATAIRLLALPPRGAQTVGGPRDEEMDAVEHDSRPLIATIGAVILFVIASLGVLYGIFLIVPALHG